jgi:hypothetical protein
MKKTNKNTKKTKLNTNFFLQINNIIIYINVFIYNICRRRVHG